MAHEIYKDSFAGVGKAWHGIGQVLEKKMTSEQALKLAKLDYEVIKVPTFVKGPKNKYIESGHYSTVRTDTNDVLGHVGKGYTVLQNSDAFKFFDPIIDRDEAIYETAGALGLAGQRTFLTAKMPAHIALPGGNDVEMYVVLSNSHDGTSAVRAMVTPVRVVCNNTLAAALSNNKSIVSIRHTSNVEYALKEAHKILGLSNTLAEELEGVYGRMLKKKVKDNVAHDLIKQFFVTTTEHEQIAKDPSVYEELISARKRNQIEECIDFYHTGVGQQEAIGTMFGVYNGITGWDQHVKTVKSNTQRLHNVLKGKVRTKAHKICMV